MNICPNDIFFFIKYKIIILYKYNNNKKQIFVNDTILHELIHYKKKIKYFLQIYTLK